MLRLLPEEEGMLEALDSPDLFRRKYAVPLSSQASPLRDVVEQTLAFQARVGSRPPWIGYAVVRDDRELVGTCGFKGNPDSSGTVEIAYFTFPEFEGQGLATAMAHELLFLARNAGGISRVIAHTLPEPNASTRVLRKAGFTFVGDADDPEDGHVWRWAIQL